MTVYLKLSYATNITMILSAQRNNSNQERNINIALIFAHDWNLYFYMFFFLIKK